MNRKAIDFAERAAYTFIDRVEELRKEEEAKFPNCDNPNPKQSGALRRASMDLTRALADMRRPG